MDVIVDAIMVMQAKRDPKKGSQELQSFSWLVSGISMVIVGSIGAYLTS